MIRKFIATAAIALALPGAALANNTHRPYRQTYPAASALCARAANGNLQGARKNDETTILNACVTLSNSYTTAADTFSQATVKVDTQLSAVNMTYRDSVQAAYQQEVTAIEQATTPAEVAQAEVTYRSTVNTDRDTRQSAVLGLEQQNSQNKLAYTQAIQTARVTFWNTVKTSVNGVGTGTGNAGSGNVGVSTTTF